MSSSGFDDLPIEESPTRLQHWKDWEVTRARKIKIEGSIGPQEYTSIKLPDHDGIRHAGKVVASHLMHLPDAKEAIREVLDALGIPRMLGESGDDPDG